MFPEEPPKLRLRANGETEARGKQVAAVRGEPRPLHWPSEGTRMCSRDKAGPPAEAKAQGPEC